MERMAKALPRDVRVYLSERRAGKYILYWIDGPWRGVWRRNMSAGFVGWWRGFSFLKCSKQALYRAWNENFSMMTASSSGLMISEHT